MFQCDVVQSHCASVLSHSCPEAQLSHLGSIVSDVSGDGPPDLVNIHDRQLIRTKFSAG